MHLIEVTSTPCTVCGRGNVPRNDGEKNVFVDLERDVNWNDPVILCEDCAIKVGSIVGMLTQDDKQDLNRLIEKKDQEIHNLKVEVGELRTMATHKKKTTPAPKVAA